MIANKQYLWYTFTLKGFMNLDLGLQLLHLSLVTLSLE